MAEPTFQQLTEQVQRLTQRVAALERQLGTRRSVAEEPAAAPTPAPALAVRDRAERLPESPQPESPLPAAQPADASLESKFGLRLANRVGAVTLVLGIAFFFRYAVENNWIGEAARVLIGIAAGITMLAAGEFAYRKNQRVFAQGITGSGAAIFYLSCYAAYQAYHLIPFSVAFFALAAATALAAALALRYESQAIAGLALFGGFLAPFLLEGSRLNPWFIPVYLAVLDASFLALSRRRGWQWCEGAALVSTSLFLIHMPQDPARLLIPVYYALFATRPHRWLFLAAHAVLLARVSALPHQFSVIAPELLGLSVAGLAILQWRNWQQFTPLLLSAAGLCWLVINSGLPSDSALITAGLLFVAFLAISIVRAFQDSEAMAVEEISALPLNATLFFAAFYARMESRAALAAVLLASLYFGIAYALRRRPLPNLPGVVSGGMGVAFLTVAAPIQFRTFRITIAWALEGTALLWISARRRISTVQAFGLIVLALATMQFFLGDLTIYSTATGHNPVANARFVTGLGLAVALFLSALWCRATTVSPAIPGLTGHFVLLTSIALEVLDWGGGTNATSAALSIVFALYAVVLVAIGTGTRTIANRYTGLALISLVVAKLYLYDVWQLDMVYRFIAFAALGALLLATSFLYSRYRDRIATWLRTEDSSPRAASATHPPPQPE